MTHTMSLIGYARASTVDGRQVLDHQLDGLNAAGCERVFENIVDSVLHTESNRRVRQQVAGVREAFWPLDLPVHPLVQPGDLSAPLDHLVA